MSDLQQALLAAALVALIGLINVLFGGEPWRPEWRGSSTTPVAVSPPQPPAPVAPRRALPPLEDRVDDQAAEAWR